MPPTTTVDVIIKESRDSSKEISTPSGDGPVGPAKTGKRKKAPKESSLPSKRIAVKKIYPDQTATKIPTPLIREVEKERTFSEESFSCLEEHQHLDKDRRAIYIARKIFRTRKSYSHMDIQRGRPGSRQSRAIVPACMALRQITPRSDSKVERSFLINSDYYCFKDGHEAEPDARLAGMRIFASIMLNSWRRKRDDVRRLNDEISKLKKNSLRIKNQIYVLNSMFKIEQKQNTVLNNRIRRMMDDQKKIQDMYTELNTSFVELKAKNCLVEKELVIRDKEYDGLNMVLGETKSKLFKCMSRERELESYLSAEQRKNQELENNKNDLLNQLTQVKFESCDKQILWQDQISEKDQELAKLQGQLNVLDKKLCDLKIKETQCQEYEKLDLSQRKTIEEFKGKVALLQEELKNSLKYKMKSALTSFPETSLQYAHLLLFYLLPAIPPPSMQSFTAPKLNKALKLIWNN